MRFDSIVYRMKLAPTITSARQLITHGHFNVNQKKVNIPSYQCQISDEISVRLKSKNLINALRHGSTKIDPNKQEQSLNAISNDKKLPMHLILDEQRLTGTISKIISLKDPIIEQYYQDLKLKPLYIIEFYSRQL